MTQTIFIDDRAAVVDDADTAAAVIEAWSHLVHELGLSENMTKLKVLTNDPAQYGRLLELGIVPADEAVILGTRHLLQSGTTCKV